ncbi:MAG: clan AA aspartic protease [Spirochaetia bacterium]|nr:clan AA aspartic protease [Spirochaetia bacterium]
MNGYFIGNRPAININLNGDIIACIIDTGFNGSLMLSNEYIKKAELPRISSDIITIADGSEIVVPTYICSFEWCGKNVEVETIGVNAEENLLGMSLLSNLRLTVDLMGEVVEIKRIK